jgi:hypothetical protein
VSATAGTTLNVNLLLATGGIVAVEATDESGLLVQAASGTPRDGASVPTDTINVVNDGPTALRLTWAAAPRATDSFLLIESDVSRSTIVQPVTNDLNGAGSIYSVKARAKDSRIGATVGRPAPDSARVMTESQRRNRVLARRTCMLSELLVQSRWLSWRSWSTSGSSAELRTTDRLVPRLQVCSNRRRLGCHDLGAGAGLAIPDLPASQPVRADRESVVSRARQSSRSASSQWDPVRRLRPRSVTSISHAAGHTSTASVGIRISSRAGS